MSAVNITAHPHPEGVYEKLIRHIHRKRIVREVHGNRSGLITQVWNSTDSELPGVYGVITTFVDFDKEGLWFDLETAEAASEDELNKVEVPDNLRPDMKRCQFILDEKNHIVSFMMDSAKGGISAGLMEKFLLRIFSEPSVVSKFGRVSVHVVHPERSVDELFKLPKIREVFIRANRPNVGDYDGNPFKNLKEWMANQNANTFEQKIASDNSDMQPSEETISLARVADENGYVTVSGRDHFNQAAQLSTKDTAPLVEQDSYNPKTTDVVDALYFLARRIADSIVRRRRGA